MRVWVTNIYAMGKHCSHFMNRETVSKWNECWIRRKMITEILCILWKYVWTYSNEWQSIQLQIHRIVTYMYSVQCTRYTSIRLRIQHFLNTFNRVIYLFPLYYGPKKGEPSHCVKESRSWTRKKWNGKILARQSVWSHHFGLAVIHIVYLRFGISCVFSFPIISNPPANWNYGKCVTMWMNYCNKKAPKREITNELERIVNNARIAYRSFVTNS